MAKKDEKKLSKDKTSFMKSFRAELKKVVWPTPKQLFNSTVAVLSIVLITAAIVFVLDFVFESVNKYGIDKIKQAVSNSVSENTVNNETENTVEENVVEENTTVEENSETTETTETIESTIEE